jgi:hypothetical protein
MNSYWKYWHMGQTRETDEGMDIDVYVLDIYNWGKCLSYSDIGL